MSNERTLHSISALLGLGVCVNEYSKSLSHPEKAPELISEDWSYFVLLRSLGSFDADLVEVFSQPSYVEFVWIGPSRECPTEVAALCPSLSDIQAVISEVLATSDANQQDASFTFFGAQHLWLTEPDYFRELLQERFGTFLAL